jgi:hypothetical protein
LLEKKSLTYFRRKIRYLIDVAIKLWFRTLNHAIRSLGWLNVGVSQILPACKNLLLNIGTLLLSFVMPLIAILDRLEYCVKECTCLHIFQVQPTSGNLDHADTYRDLDRSDSSSEHIHTKPRLTDTFEGHVPRIRISWISKLDIQVVWISKISKFTPSGPL